MKVVRNVTSPDKGVQARKTIAKRIPRVSDELRIAQTEGGKTELYSALVGADGREYDRKVYFRLKPAEVAALRDALNSMEL